MQGYRAVRGTSLLELLCCLALLALLATLGLPGFADWLGKEESASAARLFGDAIRLTRYSAITHASPATLCRSADGLSCGGSWEQGALVFLDHDADAVVDAEDQIIRLFNPPPGPAIRWRAFQNRQYLQMTPLGLTRWQNGNFTFCPRDGAAAGAQQLVITQIGRVRAAQDSDGDGIREDAQGQPLDCGWVQEN